MPLTVPWPNAQILSSLDEVWYEEIWNFQRKLLVINLKTWKSIYNPRLFPPPHSHAHFYGTISYSLHSYAAISWMRYGKIAPLAFQSEGGWISHTMTVLGVVLLIITGLSTPTSRPTCSHSGSLLALSTHFTNRITKHMAIASTF